MTTTNAVMTITDVADRFNVLAQEGHWEQIHNELYADNAKSVEPEHSKGLRSVDGLDAIKEKGKQFGDMIEEMHGGYSNEPIIAGTHFAVAMGMDVTMKGHPRLKLDEIAVYEVNNGKIVKEQFFY